MQQRPYHVIVVGAGLAGLGAAYELSKHPQYRVTVLEQRERVGGRVHTLPVNGQMIDFGGFIIYPWYTEFHRILTELKLEDQLKPIPQQKIYYQLGDEAQHYERKQIPFSKKDTALLALKVALPIFQVRDVVEPPLNSFNYMTSAEFFRDALHQPEHGGLYETYTDTITQGYGYPSVEKFKMAFMAPFMFKSWLHGNVRAASYMQSGNNKVPLALAAAIEQASGTIHCNTTVTSCHGTMVQTTTGEMNADAIIFAQNVDAAIYQTVLPDVKIHASYTQYYSVTVEFSEVPTINGDAWWGGVFYQPTQAALQIVSSIHLPILYGQAVERHVNFNIISRQATEQALSADELLQAVGAQLQSLFPNVKVQRLFNVIYWPQMMPLVDEEFVGTIRERQGKLGHYFAGDWLGAPSMETALTTGVRAAEQLIADTSGHYSIAK